MPRDNHKQIQKQLELSKTKEKTPALLTPRSWHCNLQSQNAMHFRCLSPQSGTLSQETNMLIVRVLHSVDSSRNKTETCETRAVKISSKAAGELFSLLAHHHNSYLKHNKAAVFLCRIIVLCLCLQGNSGFEAAHGASRAEERQKVTDKLPMRKDRTFQKTV